MAAAPNATVRALSDAFEDCFNISWFVDWPFKDPCIILCPLLLHSGIPHQTALEYLLRCWVFAFPVMHFLLVFDFFVEKSIRYMLSYMIYISSFGIFSLLKWHPFVNFHMPYIPILNLETYRISPQFVDNLPRDSVVYSACIWVTLWIALVTSKDKGADIIWRKVDTWSCRNGVRRRS